MIRRLSSTVWMLVGVIMVAALLRIARDAGWLPLPPNFSPISAMAIVSGVFLSRRFSLVLPLSAMLLSDAIIGFYSLPVMMSVYASFAISNVIGFWLKSRVNVRRMIGASLVGSVVFFLVTNAAVWAFQVMYPHTLSGLLQAYTAGLPFFRNTVAGDLMYTGVFVGAVQAFVVYSRKRQLSIASIANG
jgi:hypothetical protein